MLKQLAYGVLPIMLLCSCARANDPDVSGDPAAVAAGIYRYELLAREPKGGVAVASATCTADERGAVTAMPYVPTADGPALAADR